MRKHILTTIALLPLLLNGSQAAQRWTVDSPQPSAFGAKTRAPSSYLGVDISDITADRLGALKLKEEQGAEVTMVDQDAPAGKAGIKEHDVIFTMNGTAIESKTQLQRMIHETPARARSHAGLEPRWAARDNQSAAWRPASGVSAHGAEGREKDNIEVQIPPLPNVADFDLPRSTWW
jgi:hypothetical protein